MSYARTLILDVDYLPHSVVDWKDAVGRMFNGKIQVLAQYDEFLAHITKQTLSSYPALKRSLQYLIGSDVESFDVKVPAVAVKLGPARRTRPGNKYSKSNVRLRDKHTCQYCGQVFPPSALNVDHVFPKSRGGKSWWDNIVLTCFACNSKKANRTPGEAGMTLLTTPKVPKVLPIVRPKLDLSNSPSEWLPYLGVN